MAQLYRYGAVEPVYFKITLSAVAVTGLTLGSTDFTISKDGAGFSSIGLEVTEVGKGVYKWTPSAATQTQAKVVLLNLADVVGSEFDENLIILITGGDSSAFLSGD